MSEAEKFNRLLELEREKVIPDLDIIYALGQQRPYVNTVDMERLRRGNDKIPYTNSSDISKLLQNLARPGV